MKTTISLFLLALSLLGSAAMTAAWPAILAHKTAPIAPCREPAIHEILDVCLGEAIERTGACVVRSWPDNRLTVTGIR